MPFAEYQQPVGELSADGEYEPLGVGVRPRTPGRDLQHGDAGGCGVPEGGTGPVACADVKGEQEGTRMLFAGAYATLQNPSGHREVNYDDVAEAAEAVIAASLLLRILDRIERRVAQAGR